MENELVTIKGVKGYKKCPDWLKEVYRLSVKYTCQGCKKKEKEVGKLQPHRLIRDSEGGLYTIVPLNHIGNNIKPLCKKCHDKIHANEWRNVKSK